MPLLVDVWVWTWDPLLLGPIALAVALYLQRWHTLSARDQAPPWWRMASFLFGMGLVAFVLVSPVNYLAEEYLFTFHMVQHLAIGDVASLFVALGMDGAILWPLFHSRVAGRLARRMVHPFWGLAAWSGNLYFWHIPRIFSLALGNGGWHVVESCCYLLAGVIMWEAVFEPIPGPSWFGTGWKAIYVLAMRLIEGLLANILMWSGTVFYTYYLTVPRIWGISAHEDQSIGGVCMMIEGGITSIVMIAWFIARYLSDGELRDELVEMGVPAERAGRAIRRGRGPEMKRRLLALRAAATPQ